MPNAPDWDGIRTMTLSVIGSLITLGVAFVGGGAVKQWRRGINAASEDRNDAMGVAKSLAGMTPGIVKETFEHIYALLDRCEAQHAECRREVQSLRERVDTLEDVLREAHIPVPPMGGAR